MPIITIVGFSGLTQHQIDELSVRVERCTASIEPLRVREEVVDVFVDNGGYSQKTGKSRGYVRVEELFIKDDRDAEARQDLLAKLHKVVTSFATINEVEAPTGFNCFINECDLDRGNYYSPNIHLYKR